MWSALVHVQVVDALRRECENPNHHNPSRTGLWVNTSHIQLLHAGGRIRKGNENVIPLTEFQPSQTISSDLIKSHTPS